MEMDCQALGNKMMKIKVALAGLDIELSDHPHRVFKDMISVSTEKCK